MTTVDMNSFLKALDAVKQDYSCRVCKNLCKKPVALKCFHLICEEHLKDLIKCPKCDIPLLDQPVYKDETLESSVNSTFELDRIFSQYKTIINPVKITEEDTENVTVRASKNPNSKKLTSIKNKVKSSSKSGSDKKSDVAENVNTSLAPTVVSSKNTKAVEKRNKKGETVLHVSCRLGKTDKVTELLNEGASPNTKDNAGWTPLHEAVQNGRLDLVKLLLQHKALVNIPGADNETPLHEAVRYNHEDIAHELVIHGADLEAKNIKGETPVQLASNKMKKVLQTASENVIHSQDLTNLSSIQTEVDFDDLRVYCITKYRTVQNKLKTLAKHHSNVHIEPKLTKKVTHLIIDAEDGVCVPTLDVLQGIVYGIWILSTDWIIKCTIDNLDAFTNYEIRGVGTTKFNGPQNSRRNKYKQLPGVFNGCHFYLHNFNTSYEISKTLILNKTILTKLITDADGIVLRRIPNPESIPEAERLVPYHAKKGGQLEICSHYIIFKDMYEPMYNMRHLKALPVAWLLECIEKYELCEPE